MPDAAAQQPLPEDESATPQADSTRGGGGEPLFNLPAIVVLLAATCIGIHLLRAYWLTLPQDFELIVRAAFIPIRYTGGYEIDAYAFISPFSYAFLHGGLAHLALNMIWFAAFGSPLANRLGAWRFLLFWAATSLGAAGLHFAVHPFDNSPLVGASGAISGMMGAAARFGFHMDRSSGRSIFDGPVLSVRDTFRSRSVVTFLIVWFAVNLATGIFGLIPNLDAAIAWEAHIGGFLIGFFGIAPFATRSPAPQGPASGDLDA